MRAGRRNAPRRGSLLVIAAIAVLAIGSVAATSAAQPAYCPARSATAAADGLPVGCPPRAAQPLAQALGFGSVLLAAAWWAPGRRR